MITAKPKRSRAKLLAIIIIAIIVGGSITAFFLIQKNTAVTPPGFSLAVYKGTSDQQASWSPISSQDTILNGTRGLNGGDLVVVANATKGFSGFISLSMEAPKGITVQFNPVSIRPGASGVAASQLVLQAQSNVTTARDPFAFNLTGKGGTPVITTEYTFHLRIRNTMLFITPETGSVLNGNKFTVGVAVQNAYDINAFQFSVSFDPTILIATNITYAVAFSPAGTCGSGACQGFSPYTPITSGIDNTTGLVKAASALEGKCGVVSCINVSGTQTYTIANITFSPDFTRHVTGTTVNCVPNSLTNNTQSNTTCTATVADMFIAQTSLKLTQDILTEAIGVAIGEPPFHRVASSLSLNPNTQTAPSGTVTFNSTSTSGLFTPAKTCTLTSGGGFTASCSVTYTDTVHTATPQTLGATYSGDPTHAVSSNVFVLFIVPHP